ncbi:MAG: PA2779 family protein [Candidatus Omnitrophica bacterium]|nr:PA2779 family protein [Candidatus Omnitrophota bacterium]MCM8793680.1 PA2779 family protein [Candidatus Omnitrophota bacterium]
MLSFIYKEKFCFLFLLSVAIFLGIKPNSGYAGWVDSRTGMPEEKDIYLNKIKSFLEKERTNYYLKRMGIDKEVILERIAQLDPEKLKELALRCDMFKVGGGAGGILLGILILVLLIIAVLYFTNYTIKIEPRDAIPRRY